MVLEYLKGLMSGAVLVTAGLAVVSQSTLPPGTAPAEAMLETEVADAVTETGAAETGAKAGSAGPDATDEAPVGTAEAPATAEEPARLDGPQAAQDEPLLRPMTEPEAPPAAVIVPDLQTNAAVAPPDQPASDSAPAAQSAAPTEPAASEPTPQPVPEAGSQVTDVAEPAAEPGPGPRRPRPVPVTPAQLRKLNAQLTQLERADGRKLSREERRDMIAALAGVEQLATAKDLTADEASRAIEALSRTLDAAVTVVEAEVIEE